MLLDSQERRTAFLQRAVEALALGDRTTVVRARAEDAGRDPTLRHRFAVVTARSFGPPAVTAECGAPLLAAGGCLLVAEPPDAPDDRWPVAGLRRLGLERDEVVRVGDAGVRRLRARAAVGDRYPRLVGVPAKRPLF